MTDMQLADSTRHTVDVVSAAAIATSLMGWLPPVAAILGIIWYVMQIWTWVEKRFAQKRGFRRRATDQ